MGILKKLRYYYQSTFLLLTNFVVFSFIITVLFGFFTFNVNQITCRYENLHDKDYYLLYQGREQLELTQIPLFAITTYNKISYTDELKNEFDVYYVSGKIDFHGLAILPNILAPIELHLQTALDSQIETVYTNKLFDNNINLNDKVFSSNDMSYQINGRINIDFPNVNSSFQPSLKYFEKSTMVVLNSPKVFDSYDQVILESKLIPLNILPPDAFHLLNKENRGVTIKARMQGDTSSMLTFLAFVFILPMIFCYLSVLILLKYIIDRQNKDIVVQRTNGIRKGRYFLNSFIESILISTVGIFIGSGLGHILSSVIYPDSITILYYLVFLAVNIIFSTIIALYSTSKAFNKNLSKLLKEENL